MLLQLMFLAVVAFSQFHPTAAALTSTIDTESGQVLGVPGTQSASITRFLGIPFAASTAGPNRWQPPQPASKWSVPLNASSYGPVCPQSVPPMGQGRMSPDSSEDCLNLNIWTGANSPSERRPVYFWIYGGRFSGGSNKRPLYDGEGLAQKGLVVVIPNYRTGTFGFLVHPLLSAESGKNASGNYGLMDMIAALQWVQRNIGAFGGDPDKVTIGGQSAGAASVLHLVNSPLAKGLFRAAVSESGARYPRDPMISGLATSYQNIKRAEAKGRDFVRRALNVTNFGPNAQSQHGRPVCQRRCQ